ncbi:protein RhiA [Desulfovibrio sp. JY]|nr:protein RhiA [Desulfovibrio sp. JY]
MSTQYTLNVSNSSARPGYFCIYQTFDEQEVMINLFSLAWFSKGCNPGTQVSFRWSIDYGFCWGETETLVPGVTFAASETKDGDPSRIDQNSTNLTHNAFGYNFTGASKTAPMGTLGIFTDDTVPVNKAAVGISMGGSPALVVQAGPNLDFIFKPHPRYWICFGNYIQGQVIDLNMMTAAQEIEFFPNEYTIYATLQPNNTIKVNGMLSD